LAGSAASAYWCLRFVSVRVLPAALGGVLFGFSPAMVAQALGHPNLVFNVLAPVLILLAVRIMISEDPPLTLAVLLGVTAGAQVFIGEEVLFDTGVVVVLLLLVLVISYPRLALRRARLFASRALVALGAFLLVAGAPLGYQLLGSLQQEGSPFITAYYSADLAGYVVPTKLQVFAWDSAIEQANSFAGGLEEHTAYLGWPLIVLCLLMLVLGWRKPWVRIPLLVALGVAVLALGEELTILGEKQDVALPWTLIAELPGFEHVITTRFALFTAGLIGAALAFALDEAFDHPTVVQVAGLAAVTIAFIPLIPAPLPGRDAPRVPAFFVNRAAKDLACPGGSALILPFPQWGATDAMLWQQAAGMSFAMPGGYFIGPDSDGHARVGGEPSKTGSLFHDIMVDGQPRPVTSEMRGDFVADLNQWKACTVVLGPARNFDVLRRQATELIGKKPESVHGVLLWRDLSGVPAK
jgi:dolichyl-phosphate beta-glucosyltransferase